jgi:hypothetical protein
MALSISVCPKDSYGVGEKTLTQAETGLADETVVRQQEKAAKKSLHFWWGPVMSLLPDYFFVPLEAGR